MSMKVRASDSMAVRKVGNEGRVVWEFGGSC